MSDDIIIDTHEVLFVGGLTQYFEVIVGRDDVSDDGLTVTLRPDGGTETITLAPGAVLMRRVSRRQLPSDDRE